jgi:type IV pilus assembly protein PilB
MAEAVAMLRSTRPTFYRWVRTGKVKGMKVGRQWRFRREDIERFLRGEGPRAELPADITPLIGALAAELRNTGDAAPEPEVDPLESVVKLMIRLGSRVRASDIHITTHPVRDATEPVTLLRYRIDGVLQKPWTIDRRLLPGIIEQWKRVAACDVHEKALPQDGRIQVRTPRSDGSLKTLDLRVSFLPGVLGESLTVRVLDPEAVMLSLDRIPFADADRARLRQALRAPYGMVLVTGPTGCGKTTTLYAALNDVARPELKTVTVEDPVEYLLPWVNQIQVNPRKGLTFAAAVRAVLRSDPDIILVGEMRDPDSLHVVQQAVLTGHVVLSTLHTEDAVTALQRLLDMGSHPFLVADTVRLVLAQRLVRRLCRDCSVAAELTGEQAAVAEELVTGTGTRTMPAAAGYRKAVGCPKCAMTGYRGRTVIAETLAMTPEIGRALRHSAGWEEVRTIAIGQGMTPLAADGLRRAAAGETTVNEVVSALR